MLSGQDIMEIYSFWQEYYFNSDGDDEPELPPAEILTPEQVKRIHAIEICRNHVLRYSSQLKDFVPRETIVKHLEEEKLTLRTLYDTKV
jgi:hypothetical protein